MAAYDFSALESEFANIVRSMPDTFDSHQFILALARENQAEYVKALYAYAEKPAPFQAVHSMIARILASHMELVSLIRSDKTSPDIFGNPQRCAEWRKVA